MDLEKHGVVVFPTTGGIAVRVDPESITLTQEWLNGDEPSVICIPRPLLASVLGVILAGLPAYEVDDLKELCDIHSKPRG